MAERRGRLGRVDLTANRRLNPRSSQKRGTLHQRALQAPVALPSGGRLDSLAESDPGSQT
jgi:hypothetical protein